MIVVIAGADGYIGSRVYRRLSSLADTTVFRLLRRSSDRASDGTADLGRESAALVGLLKRWKPNAIVNCAGTTSSEMRACVESHVAVTGNLLAATAEAAPGARFVQLGSAAEYGEAVPRPMVLNENTPPIPQGAYAVSKLASTLLAATHGPTLGLDCIVLRVFNLIGPDMAPGTIIPKVLAFLGAAGRQPHDTIDLGRLDVYRDFIHIEDVVSAIVSAVYVPPIGRGTIINVASGTPVLVRDVVRRLLSAAGHHGEIREISGGSTRSANVDWQHPDISRAHRLLGWSPVTSLSDAILELVNGGDRHTF